MRAVLCYPLYLLVVHTRQRGRTGETNKRQHTGMVPVLTRVTHDVSQTLCRRWMASGIPGAQYLRSQHSTELSR